MSLQVNQLINDAREFQKYGDYDLAISFLLDAKNKDQKKERETEIQKLLSFNYRKIGNYDEALLHINNAINWVCKLEFSKNNQNEYAICIMNKGMIYEEIGRSDKAEQCYIKAVNIFTTIHKNDSDNFGIIINALFTLGLFYYNHNKKANATETLKEALPYFGEGKENDRRYIAICNYLQETANNVGENNCEDI